MNAAVQTCAQVDEPDMFGAPEPAPLAVACDDLVIELHGRLVNHATVCSKLVDHGTHARPVVCMEIVPIGANHTRQRIHATQVFTEARRKDAEALAASLKRGTRITLRTTLIDRVVTFPHVLSVAITTSNDHA